jgi:hypothetical protein
VRPSGGVVELIAPVRGAMLARVLQILEGGALLAARMSPWPLDFQWVA